MTKDEIEKLAREAGFMYFQRFDGQLLAGDEDGSLTLFAKLVAAAERERCAKMCESQRYMTLRPTDPFAEARLQAMKNNAKDLAALIRALK